MIEVEICSFSLQSSIEADQNGASRIELCGGFLEGGTTPSQGLVKEVLREVTVPVFIMIRPRGGDFCYNIHEQKVIKADIEEIKKLEPSGFVFGALNPDGSIYIELCQKVVEWCAPYPLTFHRAFDVCKDRNAALEQIISLGFERILTSGGANSAMEGLGELKLLNQKAAGRIQIMAGAGVNVSNVSEFVKAGLSAVHSTGKVWEESEMAFRNEKVSMASGSMPDEFGKYESSGAVISKLIRKVY
ncbi:copper homeostasis protein [Spirosomataceae bacterium TFI 002]|nr:copper homeostasis protein [Spirosomataceae bacterium TFI 002]